MKDETPFKTLMLTITDKLDDLFTNVAYLADLANLNKANIDSLTQRVETLEESKGIWRQASMDYQADLEDLARDVDTIHEDIGSLVQDALNKANKPAPDREYTDQAVNWIHSRIDMLLESHNKLIQNLQKALQDEES